MREVLVREIHRFVLVWGGWEGGCVYVLRRDMCLLHHCFQHRKLEL